MKTFKQVDLTIQVASIIAFAIAALAKPGLIIIGYFVVGALQVISMIIHAANSWHTRKGSRRYYYNIITAVTVLFMTLSSVVQYFVFIFYILLYLAPLMAIYYALICFREVFYHAKRPLELI